MVKFLPVQRFDSDVISFSYFNHRWDVHFRENYYRSYCLKQTCGRKDGLFGIYAYSVRDTVPIQLYSDSFLGHVLSSVLLGLVNGSCWVMLTTLNAKYVGVDNLSAANGIEFIFAGIGPLVISAISGQCSKPFQNHQFIRMIF